jgi:DNA invertase Pin-like site-specific DNA recombinase
LNYTQANHPQSNLIKVARIYLRCSTDEQSLDRQEEIEKSARSSGYYIAGVYREKASGARADRPELLRMIADLQPAEVVIAERIDRISRLPLAEAQKQGIQIARQNGKYSGRQPDTIAHERIIALRAAGQTIKATASLSGCSISQVKRIWAIHLDLAKGDRTSPAS